MKRIIILASNTLGLQIQGDKGVGSRGTRCGRHLDTGDKSPDVVLLRIHFCDKVVVSGPSRHSVRLLGFADFQTPPNQQDAPHHLPVGANRCVRPELYCWCLQGRHTGLPLRFHRTCHIDRMGDISISAIVFAFLDLHTSRLLQTNRMLLIICS